MILLAEGVSADVALPAGDGEFRVLLDGERGELLVVDARVDAGSLTSTPPRETSAPALRAARLLRAIPKAFTLPVRNAAENRRLIASLVRRDIASRYRGSFIGLFWTVLNPLLLMSTYFFVFGVVLQARFAADPSRHGFVLYFLAGMLPWLSFAEAAGRAPNTILENRVLVKKLVFPLDILNIVQTGAALTNQVIALAIFLVYLLAARGSIPAAGLWTPVLLVPQILFTLGVAWFLAALGAYVRDLAQIIGFLLTLWFFLTPICYPESSLPPALVPVLAWNPMFQFVRAWRTIFLEGGMPPWGVVAALWALGVLTAAAGYAWFHKLRKGFADVL